MTAQNSHSSLQAKSRRHHRRVAPRKQATPFWQFRQTTLRKPKHAPARDGRRGTTNGASSSPPPFRQSQRRIAAALNSEQSRTPQLTEPPKRCSPSVEVAARAVGLDCGPMSGVDLGKVDAEFFPDGRWKTNFLINLGYGDDSLLFKRNARLGFDEACRVL